MVLTYLSEHNAYPYAKGLSYNGDIGSIICCELFLHMDMEVMDSPDDMMSTNLYDIWIYLWEMYGDPHIPPFPKDILPPIVAASSLDEITPPDALVATTDIVLAKCAPYLVHYDLLCLPISASWDDFLPDIAVLSMESYIEDVGDIIDDIHLLFVEETSSSHVATL